MTYWQEKINNITSEFLDGLAELPNKRSERITQKTGMHKTGEFDHPLLEKGHWLQRAVLYEISNPHKTTTE